MCGKILCNGFNGTNDAFNRDTMRGNGEIKTFLKKVEGGRVKK
jgi:hypothetical protein